MMMMMMMISNNKKSFLAEFVDDDLLDLGRG